jgi:hypothetical protein
VLFPGVDYIEAFGGRERILRLGTFLEDLKSEGAAIHIISHGYKNEILKVVPSENMHPRYHDGLIPCLPRLAGLGARRPR